MKLLPTRTAPWRTPFERRHSPGGGPYTSFRQCLRWEFGFSCSICLCHEADLFIHGVEGSGLMQIEHRLLQSESPAAKHSYPNCLYVCRFCNLARGTKPLASPAGNLLSPSDTAWAYRFELNGDRLSPRAGDADARYTYQAYDLDDPKKLAMRAFRHERMSELLAVLEKGPASRDLLFERGLETSNPDLIGLARQMDDAIRRAFVDLMKFGAVPGDSATCSCAPTACSLPLQLEEQTIEW